MFFTFSFYIKSQNPEKNLWIFADLNGVAFSKLSLTEPVPCNTMFALCFVPLLEEPQ